VFIAMGSVGIQGVIQRVAISAAAAVSSIEQVTRLSVLNTSAKSGTPAHATSIGDSTARGSANKL
jgi:hypothetical protein